MLHGTKLYEAVQSGNISIESTNDTLPFTLKQVTEDSIDLRLGNYGYVMNNKYDYINTLSKDDFSMYYKKVDIPLQGFILQPHQILFVPTLEKICMMKSRYYGCLTGRSVFARMGLSIHCTQSKFTAGMNSIVPLQLINNNDKIALKIYPYQKVAQLLIEMVSTDGEPVDSSESQFATEDKLQFPKILDKDIVHYKNDLTKDSICESPPLSHIKVQYSNDILKQYCERNIGEFRSIAALFSGTLGSLIIGLIGMSRSTMDYYLPLKGWIILILVSSVGSLYFWGKYFQIFMKIRKYRDSDK